MGPPSAEEDRRAREAEYRGVGERYGLTLDEAADLLDFQEESLGLISEAQRRHPDTFAGGWMEDKSSGGTLVLAFTHDAEESAAGIGQDSPRRASIRAELVRHSEVERERIRASVVRRFDEMRRDTGLFGISVRPWIDRVVLQLPRRTPESTERLEQAFGAEHILIEAAPQPATQSGHPPSMLGCEFAYTSCNPLRGGIQLQRIGCSMGFNAIRNDNLQRVITTAGHCSNGNADHSGSLVGALMPFRESEDGLVDAQLNGVSSWWDTSYYVLAAAEAQAYQIQFVYRGVNLSNFEICSSGNSTGPFGNEAACGPVLDPNWSGFNSDGNYLQQQFVFDRRVAAQPGDSGGPCFSNQRARGVVWGRFGHQTWCSYAVHAETELNMTIRSRY